VTPRLRRTWPQRFVIVAGTGLVAVCLVAAWGLADAYESIGEIAREAVSDGVLTEQPDGDAGGPRNILLVGSTENAGIDPDDPLVDVREDTALADTIMVLRVDPAARTAVLLTINRDLYVPEGPWGYSGRINGAYRAGQVELLITVVREYLGIDVHDFVKVNFAGFRALIDEIGGVPVYFEHPMKDDGSGFAVNAGCQLLDGVTSLNYARSRKMQVDPDGDGDYERADGWSDRDRTERQRDFLLLTLQRAIDKGARDPQKLRGMLDAANDEHAFVLDQYLTVDDVIDIAGAFGDFSPENLQRYSIVTTDEKLNGQDILRLDEDLSRPFIDLVNGRETLANADVHVDVVEARAPVDRGDDVATPVDELRAKGFDVHARTAYEADRSERTTITYSPDQDRFALLVARNLATRPVFQPVTGRDLLVLHVGADWRGVTLVPLPEEDFADVLPAAAPATSVPAADTPTAVDTPTSVDTPGAGILGVDPETGLLCRTGE
jgi:LCP family protein required for cell wall assembly